MRILFLLILFCFSTAHAQNNVSRNAEGELIFLERERILNRLEEDAPANIVGQEEDPARKATAYVIEQKEDWVQGAWMKSLVEIAMESRKSARTISAILQKDLMEFMAVFLVIWLLFQVGKLLTAFGPMEGNSSKVLNDIVMRILLAMIVALLIRSPDIVWKIHESVATAGTGVAQLMVTAAASLVDDPDLADITCGEQFITASGELKQSDPGNTDPIDESLAIAQLECTVEMTAKTLGIGLKMGIDLFTGKNNGGQGNASQNSWDQFKKQSSQEAKRPILLPVSLAMMYFFGSIMIAIPFRIIDVVFKWTIITILAPVMLVAFLFPVSRNIATAGLKVLFHSAFTLVILAAAVSIIFALIVFVINDSDYGSVANVYESKEIVTKGLASKLLIYMLTIGLFGKAMVDGVPALTSRALSMSNTLKIPELGSKMFGTIASTAYGLTGGAAGNALAKNFSNRKQYNQRLTSALKSSGAGKSKA